MKNNVTNSRIMKNDFSYDLLIIGGGISACVFATSIFKIIFQKKLH